MSVFRLTRKLSYQVSNAQNIIIDYADLKSGKDLTELVEKAYGPQGKFSLILGHGILFVNGIPDYPEARKATLPSIWELGNLPTQTLKKYERP